jgi:U3 small nucleolar RNA-associated protein 5
MELNRSPMTCPSPTAYLNSTLNPPLSQPIIPSASSLSTVLTQALNSSDEKLLPTCFQQIHTHETIHNTLLRLSPPLVPSLLSYFNSVLSRKPKRTEGMLDWICEVVVIHAGYLVSQGDEIKQVLEQLKGTLQRRGQTWERLVRLKGRLELLWAVKGPEGSNVGK